MDEVARSHYERRVRELAGLGYRGSAADNASAAVAVLSLAEDRLRRPDRGVEPVRLFADCEEAEALDAAAWEGAECACRVLRRLAREMLGERAPDRRGLTRHTTDPACGSLSHCYS